MVVNQMAALAWATRAPEGEPAKLGPKSTVRDVVRTAVAEGATQLLDSGARVSLGTDPEDVHKCRVATRRMRSQLKAFSVAVEETWLEEVRFDLGWLAGGLGAVRDADVMMERIRRRVAELPPADTERASELVDRLYATRDDAAREVRAMLGSGRFHTLVERLRAAATDPPVRAIGAEKAKELTAPLVLSSWSRLEKSVSSLPDCPSDEDLHEVRIKTKRCRYTTELLAPVMKRSKTRPSLRALTELQGVLGDIHDSHASQMWLRESARTQGQALVAGMMVAAEAREHERLLQSWPRVWLKARKVKPGPKANK